MPVDTPTLEVIQRWMQAVLTHPDGVADGVDSPAARDQIDLATEALEQVLTRSRALSATDRLGVYANAYSARLLECLRDEFPTLVHALGEELFDEFAFDYLQTHPSKSYTLSHLGANFPTFLAETCPADENPDWAAFLIDLAILERVYGEVFDGPGGEGLKPLSADRLAEIPPAQWPAIRLTPTAELRLVELRAPVHEYITGVRRKQEPAFPEPAETLLAVHRRDFVVRRHRLTRPQFVLLGSLQAGDTVGEAIEKAADHVTGDTAEYAAALRGWFRRWTAEGLFRDIEFPTNQGVTGD